MAIASGVEAAREALRAAAARGQGGRAALQRYSDCVDHLLQRLFGEAPDSAGASLIVAVGGDGRRQLFLPSDVDVLLLFYGPIRLAEEGRVRSLLHPLLGLRLSLGHPIPPMKDLPQL